MLRRALSLILLLLYGCGNATGIVNPRGPIAAHIAELWWLLLFLALGVFVPVIGLLLYALFHKRGDAIPQAQQDLENRLVIGGGIVMPVLVLSFVFVLTIRSTVELSTPPPDDMTIRVTGHRWWWQVDYTEYGFETANEIHIPANKNVRVELVTADVIHSFWLPELSGKVDLIPNHTNTLQLNAAAPGDYLGYCAEFCGLQHTLMKFRAVALTQADFDAWTRRQQTLAVTPTTPGALRGHTVFMTAGCAECHTVRGTDAQGRRGPDLTHVGSRRTLAAGTLENTRDTLAQWIREPDKIKRDSNMPPTPLNEADLAALLDYMEALQ